jgi:hypothetical protein
MRTAADPPADSAYRAGGRRVGSRLHAAGMVMREENRMAMTAASGDTANHEVNRQARYAATPSADSKTSNT